MEKSTLEIQTINEVLQQLGLSPDQVSSNWTYTGQEPPLACSVALALAARTAVAVQALTVAEFWALCGGAPQTISVDRHNGLFALCSGLFQSSYGHDMSIAQGAKAALSDFYATRDERWFHPMGTYPGLRDGALDLLQCANSPEAISRAVRNWNALELEEAFADAGLAGAMVRSKAEWKQHPQGQILDATPLVAIEKIADGPAGRAGAPTARPLSGLRVLDFTHVIAGPVLVRTLAEHGADCLRISAPAYSDPLQFLIDTDWGKRSAYIDLKDATELNHLQKTYQH